MDNFFYHGIWRMDWGLGNPNKTAALIAMLMVAAWIFAYGRKWGFWIALLLFTGLGVGLIHTFSRGGIIALFAGLIPVVYFASRPWPWSKIIGIVLSVWMILGCSIYWDAQGRYEQGISQEDKSISNRLEIWKVTPQMMVDAPGGWGLGNSGKAYMQWYQPLDRTEEYRTLVNSHLTWLVEVGWSLRFFYILGWFVVLLLCWPSRNLRALAIPLGVWVVFAIAATFSSVAESPWLWLLPATCLAVSFVLRLRTKIWPKPWMWGVPFAATVIIMAVILLLGESIGKIPVHKIGRQVIIGNEKPNEWVVIDHQVMGQNYGHSLRSYIMDHGLENNSIGVTDSIAELPDAMDTQVMIAGKQENVKGLIEKLAKAKRIVLLNPTFFPSEIGQQTAKTTVVFGEFSQSPSVSAWTSPADVKRIDGAGSFIANWQNFLTLTP